MKGTVNYMKSLKENEMRNINGGWYYCRRCKSWVGSTWFAAGLHVIFTHNSDNKSKYLEKR
jgi:hypothetical protein